MTTPEEVRDNLAALWSLGFIVGLPSAALSLAAVNLDLHIVALVAGALSAVGGLLIFCATLCFQAMENNHEP
jgi:hypothetical protein